MGQQEPDVDVGNEIPTSKVKVRPKFVLAAVIALLGIAVLVFLLNSASPSKFDVKDPSFKFTFCTLTSGTNHVVVSGNRLLGWLNSWMLPHLHIRPISRDRVYKFRTPQAEQTIITVGYTQQGNPESKPTNPFKAVVVQAGGQTVRVKPIVMTFAIPKNDHVAMWVLPLSRQDSTGCELRLSLREGGKDVATIRLQ